MTVKFFTKSSSAISIMKNFVVTLCDYVTVFGCLYIFFCETDPNYLGRPTFMKTQS
ncbi:unnamed protein product [Tenebrio molitor]|nr:unnamed protein product [Tenebrio molitor]